MKKGSSSVATQTPGGSMYSVVVYNQAAAGQQYTVLVTATNNDGKTSDTANKTITTQVQGMWKQQGKVMTGSAVRFSSLGIQSHTNYSPPRDKHAIYTTTPLLQSRVHLNHLLSVVHHRTVSQ